MKVAVWVLDADFEASVSDLLHRRYGAFLGQPFGLKCGGVMMTDCLLTWNNGSSMKFIFSPRQPLEEVATAILAG